MRTTSNTTPPTKHPGGRRKGSGNTRDAILLAAVEMFAERGYAGTTLRSITDRAGVDVAMVSHFFGGKQGLFDEAVLQRGLQIVGRLFDSRPQGRSAAELLDAYFSIWEDPETAKTVRALFRATLESEERRAELQALVATRLSGAVQLLAQPGPPRSRAASENSSASQQRIALQTQLIAAHLLGVGLSRYIVQVPPLSSTPRKNLVAQLTPVLEAYLAGA